MNDAIANLAAFSATTAALMVPWLVGHIYRPNIVAIHHVFAVAVLMPFVAQGLLALRSTGIKHRQAGAFGERPGES